MSSASPGHALRGEGSPRCGEETAREASVRKPSLPTGGKDQLPAWEESEVPAHVAGTVTVSGLLAQPLSPSARQPCGEAVAAHLPPG